MNYLDVSKNPKQFLAVTGVTVEKFNDLLPDFESHFEAYIAQKTIQGKPRLNKYRPRKAEGLSTIEDKLFFILYYMKNNNLQEVQGAAFGITQPMTNNWIRILTPIIEKTLKNYLPSEFSGDLKKNEISEVAIDGTERPIQRPSSEQATYYSGKEKAHTIKNLVMVTLLGGILAVSPTVEGSMHDKALADECELPKNVILYADLGFIGLAKEFPKTKVPHKNYQNVTLTQEQKQENKDLNKKRVVVEHAFAGIKIFRIVKEICRCHGIERKHSFFLIACALHNFKNGYKTKNVA